MEELLNVGVITSTHGVRGEVKVYPTTDDAKRFKKLKKVLLDKGNGFEGVKVESVKFFKQFVILKLEGINDCDEALKYKNKELKVNRKDAVKCDDDEYFIADLIDCKVCDEENNCIGTVTEVFQTGANDVYEIKREDGSSALIPAIKDCIKRVDIVNKTISIKVLPGLFD